MKLHPQWRYRIWTHWHDLGLWCGWLALPYRTVTARLWDWCHYRHGLGKHLELRKRTWRELWSNEVYKQRFGEE
jgi:hypothetical protein